jgi:hypothetical protein
MRLSADTPGLRHTATEVSQITSLSITTEPNNAGEFIEIQIAEQRDGLLTLVIAGDALSDRMDRDGNLLMRVWPTARKAAAGKK